VSDRDVHSRVWLLAADRSLLASVQRLSARMLAIGIFVAAVFVAAVSLGSDGFTREQDMPRLACRQPEAGSTVPQLHDIRSHDGVLQLDLTIYDQKQPDGSIRYCYAAPDGTLSPTLRLNPGDLLILRFKNNLIDFESTLPSADDFKNQPIAGPICTSKKVSDPCAGGAMTADLSPICTFTE
jgi:hypothetical protein